MIESKIYLGFGDVGVGHAVREKDNKKIPALILYNMHHSLEIGEEINKRPKISANKIYISFHEKESIQVIREALDRIEKEFEFQGATPYIPYTKNLMNKHNAL